MAVIVVLLGGLIGFASALVSLVMGADPMTALMLWSGIGLGATALAMASFLLPRRERPAPDATAETA